MTVTFISTRSTSTLMSGVGAFWARNGAPNAKISAPMPKPASFILSSRRHLGANAVHCEDPDRLTVQPPDRDSTGITCLVHTHVVGVANLDRSIVVSDLINEIDGEAIAVES